MRSVVLLLICCFGAASVQAQGFNTFSGRNHPELDWRVAETEHFRIMYPAHLAGIEAAAAPIAEASYDALSANLNVTFDDKIRIYLSDEDEITNGFAVDVGGGYTNIWVHLNDAATWTGPEKWLRKVIAHELAHIFHYRAVRSPLGALARLISNPMPRFWAEGFAQYETETWNAQRGDRWLRTAVLDDALSYNDGRSIWNGRLLYAVGNAQLRYFATVYGDSALARLLAHRKKKLFGLTRVHDFHAAFRATTKKSYRLFYEDWRRHVNVYYNTLAGQMENRDSLGVRPLAVPGQYVYDVQYNADTTHVAVLSLESLRRPIRRLYVIERDSALHTDIVAEGGIEPPVAWSPDGRQIAYARLTRGRYGSLVTDLYLVDRDGRNRRRLTRSRRAAAPSFSPDGRRLVFAGSAGGTTNLFVLDLATGEETQLTRFTGDVQLSVVSWHPSGERIAFDRFTPEGVRDVVVLDLATGALEPITAGETDDRGPVWSPDGTQIAYTSLRDDVPNTFVYDLATGTHRRVTFLATGAAVHDWLPPDSARAAGSLIVSSNVSKERDRAFRIDAARTVPDATAEVPPAYAAWTTHRPPHTVPVSLPPDTSLITGRYAYSSWRNITHAVSLAVPYYEHAGDWGLVGVSTWLEPLGKHFFSFIGGLSIADPLDKSLFLASYLNNQWYPALGFNLYSFPGSTRIYGRDLLVENLTGGDVTALWPVDWVDRPYVSTTFGTRLRYVDLQPLDVALFDEAVEALPAPEAGQQADLNLSFTARKQRPYRDNLIHPLDGLGLQLQVTGAGRLLGADSEFIRGDVSAFGIFPGLGLDRIFLYGRAQAQTGTSFAQDYIGLSRYDDVQIALPGLVPLTLGNAERVRGYRAYALGDRLLFGTVEYRVPLLSSLQTTLLGLVSLGSTSLALFTDAALVWRGADFDAAVRRVGAGVELKNALQLGGFLEVSHALGIAQPVEDLGRTDRYDLYYRLRAAVPF